MIPRIHRFLRVSDRGLRRLAEDVFGTTAADAGIVPEDAEPELIDLPEPEPIEVGEGQGTRDTSKE
jgi:hypothetical protein